MYVGVFGRRWNNIFGSERNRWQLGEFDICSNVETQLRRSSGGIFFKQTRQQAASIRTRSQTEFSHGSIQTTRVI